MSRPPWLRRLTAFCGGLLPSVLAGGFVLLVVGRAMEPDQNNRLGLLLLGGVIGIAIVALIRLFRVARWAYPLAGLLAGPVPLALVINGETSPDEVGGLLLFSALLGICIGVLEWARQVQVERNSGR